jgi:hypothetical protein
VAGDDLGSDEVKAHALFAVFLADAEVEGEGLERDGGGWWNAGGKLVALVQLLFPMDIHMLGCATFVGDEMGRRDREDMGLVEHGEVLDDLLA